MRIYKAINHIYQHINGVPIPRKRTRNATTYMCTDCKYESNRQYNVQRHQQRIHANRKLRVCCGIKFLTKGAYYVHCEQLHPERRTHAVMSKIKYKITSDTLSIEDRNNSVENDNPCSMQLRSRFSQSIHVMDHDEQTDGNVRVEYSLTCSEFDIEDIPLISFLTDRRLMSFLKTWSSTGSVKKTVDESRKENANQTVKRNIEKAVSTSELENIRISSTSSVASLSRELPTKKRILHRFMSSMVQEFEIPLRDQNNNDCDQMNFEDRKTKENGSDVRQGRSKNCRHANRKMDKENVSAFAFSVEQQLNVELDTGITVPVATQLHRDFLASIDFDKYKIF